MSATQFFPGMSFADTTTNSSQAIPGPNVICLILPRGISLRTVAPYNMFGRTISSTYCAWPVTLSRPSAQPPPTLLQGTVQLVAVIAAAARLVGPRYTDPMLEGPRRVQQPLVPCGVGVRLAARGLPPASARCRVAKDRGDLPRSKSP